MPDTIGRSYTDTNTGLYEFFCTENAILCGYRRVWGLYVCGVYAWKYGIGLKLDRTIGIGTNAQISIGRYPILVSV